MVATEIHCPECQSRRTDPSVVCPTCGAPPVREGDKRASDEEVRSQDLEPYVTLRYIARLFKVLAVLLILLLLAEVIIGLSQGGSRALPTLLIEATRLVVFAGFLWGAGDMALMFIESNHDLRATRILVGRLNARTQRIMQHQGLEEPASPGQRPRAPRSDR